MCVCFYLRRYVVLPKNSKKYDDSVCKKSTFLHTLVLCVLIKTRSFVGCFGQTRKRLTPPFKGTTLDAKKKKKEKKKKNGDFTDDDDDDDAGQGGGNGGRRVVGVVVERWHLAAS